METNYKGYTIESYDSSAFIYKDGELIKCVASDYPKDNALDKAKKRIDDNKLVNNIIIEQFNEWIESDNVIKTKENTYRTQCNQYAVARTKSDLLSYFIKEYH